MIRFRVSGVPIPQGSMRARVIGPKRASVFHANPRKLNSWRRAIETCAKVSIRERDRAKDEPIAIELLFELPRPKTARRRPSPSVKPDLDKLVRAVFDALEGVAFTNDSRVVSLVASKAYAPDGGEPGVTVSICCTADESGIR